MSKFTNRLGMMAACVCAWLMMARSLQAAYITSDFIFRHNTTGSDAVWVMDGIFLSTPSLLSPDPVSDLNWKIVGSADFNRDGHSDLVWWHATSGQIKLWYMNGQNRTSEVSFSPSASSSLSWRIVGVADFNRDGKPDLLWQHATTYEIAIWYMNGVTLLSTTATSPSSAAANWWIVGTGDFNYDGRPDFLFQHQTLGDLAIWYMNGSSLLSSTLTTPTNPGSGWLAIDAATMNPDTKPDILFQHTDSTIAVWYMNGASLTAATLTEPSAPGDVTWRIVATGEITLASADTDADGLPDTWEILHFGNLTKTADDDSDGDGASNIMEFRNGTSPTVADFRVSLGRPAASQVLP